MKLLDKNGCSKKCIQKKRNIILKPTDFSLHKKCKIVYFHQSKKIQEKNVFLKISLLTGSILYILYHKTFSELSIVFVN